ncbi:Small GTPase like protein [Aduncisulcus paluster]|uniref:Small GTPase like protein n=1 Tax=Aduncisulcus paluster TaxID=2918883 RepID=A0ABQ5JY21_9EUKA|nr:Small GTPase like protein [Aduncisulcus paluster]|eukprot:gnl/Carplike_NY0171/5039_a6878_388.p1 GENE.gnl/Carplike_NY0171/5039_a6878_388~~gnl/Carplike_NY0171/5039_a6878_388.p1  ORF type:complete len:198 (+),score=45.64 gnl/Carplike_NY0171/5039_a6878_388:66-659(+)
MSRVKEVKLVLLGASGCGKSSIVLRFVTNQFKPFQEPTIGASFLTKTVVVDETAVKFQIWDTAGQEKYHTLTPMYYRGAKAAIIVYDITRKQTFGTVRDWIKELRQMGSEDTIIIVAGNKCDLEAQREVPTEEAKTEIEDCGGIFFETSAKTAQCINDMFVQITHHLPRDDHDKEDEEEPGLDLEEPADIDGGGCGC